MKKTLLFSLAALLFSANAAPLINTVKDPRNPKEEPVTISKGRLELRPTYENCSYYLNLLPEEYNRKLQMRGFYREQGKKEWLPVFHPTDVAREHAWRGSLFFLKENTPYEFKAELSGDSGYKKTVTGNFRTLDSKKKFVTVSVPAGKWKTQVQSGTPQQYRRYTSGGKTVTGTKGRSILELENVHYVIFENIVFDAKGFQDAFFLKKCSNIIIRNCELYGFGRTKGKRIYIRASYNGALCSGKTLFYDEQAFRLLQSRDILIERCYIHTPAFNANSWLFGHPAGCAGIKATDCDNTVVRYNDFVGKHKARFIDHIQGPSNGSFRGGLARDSDVYGNLFVIGNDDGAELEGGGLNIRYYHNRTETTMSGVSTGACHLGPCYVIRNLFCRPGEENLFGGGGLKNGCNSPFQYGTVYLIHNTVADTRSNYGVGNFSAVDPKFVPVLKAYLRGNILESTGKIYHRLWNTLPQDCDGNLLWYKDPDGEGAKLCQAEQKKHRQETHGVKGEPLYCDQVHGNYNLTSRSPGFNQAMELPGLPRCRHIGALQNEKNEWFPKRPLDLAADKLQLHWSKQESQEQKLVLTPGKTLNAPFTVRCNDDFFTVTPEQGKFEPGKQVTFTVKLKPEAMKEPRRYYGAILFRTSDGLSLPVTLFADRRGNIEKILSDPAKFQRSGAEKTNPKKKIWQFRFNVPEQGAWFALLRMNKSDDESASPVKIITEKGKFTTTAVMLRDRSWARIGKNLGMLPLILEKGEQTITLETDRKSKILPVELILTKEPWIAVQNIQ